MDWSAAQYTKFEAERSRPVRDLLAQLPTQGVRTALDLGCGPGNSTELLRDHYPGATIAGIDRSEDMIAAARGRLPGVEFTVGDLATWEDSRSFDVILANASLQWVPDHAALLPRLLERLTPGGSLAVQVPDNLAEPAHRLIRAVASDGPWAERLAAVGDGMPPRHPADWYLSFLTEIASSVDVWHTTYFHVLPGGPAAVAEWFKGTALRPFLAPLSAEDREEFVRRYTAALNGAYPVLVDGAVVLPFPRLFFVATR